MISVIVPVFNAEKYLCRCVECVSAQSFTDWELILVNDGSTDTSETIALSLAENDSRIRAISMSNNGPSAARNRGLMEAKGEYIFFLDADDEIHPLTLEIMSGSLMDEKADMVVAKTICFSGTYLPSAARKKVFSRFQKYILSGREAAEKALYQREINASACGKLFRKELFEELKFQEGIRYEDLLLMPFIFLKSKIVVDISLPLYFYRQHATSYLHTPSLSRNDALKVTTLISHKIESIQPELLPAAHDRELSAAFNMLILFSSKSFRRLMTTTENETLRRTTIAICRQKIRRLRLQSLLNNKVRPKNKAAILLSYLFI